MAFKTGMQDLKKQILVQGLSSVAIQDKEYKLLTHCLRSVVQPGNR